MSLNSLCIQGVLYSYSTFYDATRRGKARASYPAASLTPAGLSWKRQMWQSMLAKVRYRACVASETYTVEIEKQHKVVK